MKMLKPTVSVARPMIFTNGAFVSPGKVVVNGREVWCWFVESFEDDSFYDGTMVYPRENAYDKDDLLAMTEREFDSKPRSI